MPRLNTMLLRVPGAVAAPVGIVADVVPLGRVRARPVENRESQNLI